MSTLTWTEPRDWTDDELVLARYGNDVRDQLAYLYGLDETEDPPEAQAQTSRDIPVKAPGLATEETGERMLLRHQFVGTASLFELLSEIATTVDNGDATSLILGLANTAGTVEPLARIDFLRVSAGEGALYFYVYNAGVATLALALRHNGRIGVKTASPGYDVDVDGTVNAESYVGLNLWQHYDVTTIAHEYADATTILYLDAEVTNQWISQVATGTAPLVVNSSAVVQNLDVDLLEGLSWSAGATSDADSVSVSSAGTDYTVATAGSLAVGFYLVVGEMTITIDAGDTGKTFTGSVTGSPRSGRGKAADSGREIHFALFGFYRSPGSGSATLKVRKAGGSGSSTAAGSIVATRIGP